MDQKTYEYMAERVKRYTVIEEAIKYTKQTIRHCDEMISSGSLLYINVNGLTRKVPENGVFAIKEVLEKTILDLGEEMKKI